MFSLNLTSKKNVLLFYDLIEYFYKFFLCNVVLSLWWQVKPLFLFEISIC